MEDGERRELVEYERGDGTEKGGKRKNERQRKKAEKELVK
jgi:hypothetical protein